MLLIGHIPVALGLEIGASLAQEAVEFLVFGLCGWGAGLSEVAEQVELLEHAKLWWRGTLIAFLGIRGRIWSYALRFGIINTDVTH